MDKPSAQKRDRIVASIRKGQTRYLKKCHKFGIELPKTVEQAVALDAKSDNIFFGRPNIHRNGECQSGI